MFIYPGPSDNYLEPAPHSWVTSIPGPLGLTMQQSTTFAEHQQPSPLGPHIHGTHLLVTATSHRLSLHIAYHCLQHLRVHLGPHSGCHNVTALDMLVPQDKPTQYSTGHITTCPPPSVIALTTRPLSRARSSLLSDKRAPVPSGTQPCNNLFLLNSSGPHHTSMQHTCLL